MPTATVVAESSVPILRSVDNLESRNFQLKVMEMAAQRYASFAP